MHFIHSFDFRMSITIASRLMINLRREAIDPSNGHIHTIGCVSAFVRECWDISQNRCEGEGKPPTGSDIAISVGTEDGTPAASSIDPQWSRDP